VAGLIESEFGVSYSLAHVRNILVGLLGDDQWPLTNVRFWARMIELVYPEWSEQVLIEDFDDGLVLNWRVVGELRRRLRS